MDIKNLNKAIFLDRDGTINEDVGDFCSLDKLIFIPRAFESLRMLQKGYLLFIITNQSGVGKGLFSEKDLLQFNAEFYAVLKKEEISIQKVYYCPHTKETNCICRKPAPYFLKMAERDYDIDLKNSFVIGDHPHDIEMAHKVGAGSVYLLTGHGRKHRQELSVKPNFIANDIYESAVWITDNHKPEAKVEISGNLDEVIDVRYFDTPEDELYRSWKLPRPVAEELIKWWRMTKINQKTIFPINSRSGKCEFTMHTEKCIEIKEIDSLGRTKITGWSLPSEIAERLIIWQKDQ